MVRTHIDQARTRVGVEREAVSAKLDAFDAFIDRVEDLSTEASRPSAPGNTATAGTLVRTESTADRCRAVRTAFAETVRPHSVADVDESESLLETIQNELSDAVAVALAPTTDASFSPELKRAIVSEAATRRAETAALRRALNREATHLESADEAVEEITDWIVDADETPLTDLGFEELRHRHETLARHRDRCEELAMGRQEFLKKTTNQNAEAGIRHRSLVPYIYQEFPMDHPLLVTVARLNDACAECQRAVRRHLVRRV